MIRRGTVWYRGLPALGQDSKQMYSNCLTPQELLIGLTGARTPQTLKDARGDISWPLTCSLGVGKFLISFSNHAWSFTKGWPRGWPCGIQLLRRAENFQNLCDRGGQCISAPSFPLWLSVCWVPDRKPGTGETHVRGWHAAVLGLLTCGSAGRPLGLSAPSWFGHAKGPMRHFLCELRDRRCVKHP